MLGLGLLLAGCGTNTLFLKKDQYLFVSAKIKGTKKIEAEALANLQQQKPNRRILRTMPYLWFYQLGEKFYRKDKVEARMARTRAKYDAKLDKVEDKGSAKALRLRNLRDQKLDKLRTALEEGNWLMRTVGEPPSIFDPSAVALSAREMRNYLFNKGFFAGQVSARVDTLRGRQVRVTYTVAEGLPQLLRRVRYQANDPRLQHLADSLTTKGQLLTKPGDRYDQDNISAERERLDKGIRNSGYYAFSRDFIFVEADTGLEDSALGTRGIDLVYRIKDPRQGRHQRYRIGEAELHISSAGGFYKSDTSVRTYNGITYYTPYKRLSYRTLDSKILVRPGDYYNAEGLTNSQAQLQAMDFFRFVNFSFDTLPSGKDFRLNIQTTRLPKYQISDEVGMLVSQGAPGPFVNLGFKVRNGLNAFDIFEASARYSEEGQISVFNQEGIFRAREIGLTTALIFPTIAFPWGTSYLFNNYNPKTRLSLGYTDTRRPEYSQSTIRATAGYSINLSQRKVIGINVIDAAIVRTGEIADGWRNFLIDQSNRGNPLIQSFNNQVVTSLSGFYIFNTSSQTAKVRGQYLRIFGEVGGFLPNLFATTIQDGPEVPTEDRRDGRYITLAGLEQDLRIFRFGKLQLDYRYYLPVAKNTLWAFRINTGIAVPLGDSRALPYVKYFFAGGSNSVRAWAPRRLGPGRYFQTGSGQPGFFNAEQPGEILFEGSVELRQKLIGFFEGALFADFGNVYSIRAEEGRPGGNFTPGTFVQNMALGIGPGLRMDFSFLVVRLDAGIKAYDPAAPYGNAWVIRDLFRPAPEGYQRVLLNIGIGYPF